MTTVAAVLARYGTSVTAKFAPLCRRYGTRYPPPRIALLAFKDERQLEIWGANASGKFYRLATFPILAASGTAGPKRQEGDNQVPEGVYAIDLLNPMSRFHLSLRIAYPNPDDLRRSTIPRSRMGGDIYIHGSNVSIGCIAMGDAVIEEVFCLVALAQPAHRQIVIAPGDLRRRPLPAAVAGDVRLRPLYTKLRNVLRSFPVSG